MTSIFSKSKAVVAILLLLNLITINNTFAANKSLTEEEEAKPNGLLTELDGFILEEDEHQQPNQVVNTGSPRHRRSSTQSDLESLKAFGTANFWLGLGVTGTAIANNKSFFAAAGLSLILNGLSFSAASTVSPKSCNSLKFIQFASSSFTVLFSFFLAFDDLKPKSLNAELNNGIGTFTLGLAICSLFLYYTSYCK